MSANPGKEGFCPVCGCLQSKHIIKTCKGVDRPGKQKKGQPQKEPKRCKHKWSQCTTSNHSKYYRNVICSHCHSHPSGNPPEIGSLIEDDNDYVPEYDTITSEIRPEASFQTNTGSTSAAQSSQYNPIYIESSPGRSYGESIMSNTATYYNDIAPTLDPPEWSYMASGVPNTHEWTSSKESIDPLSVDTPRRSAIKSNSKNRSHHRTTSVESIDPLATEHYSKRTTDVVSTQLGQLSIDDGTSATTSSRSKAKGKSSSSGSRGFFSFGSTSKSSSGSKSRPSSKSKDKHVSESKHKSTRHKSSTTETGSGIAADIDEGEGWYPTVADINEQGYIIDPFGVSWKVSIEIIGGKRVYYVDEGTDKHYLGYS